MNQQHLALLRVHDACQGLSMEEIDAIAAEAEVVQVKAGDSIHAVGEQLNYVHIVVSGRLKMLLKTPGGDQRTVQYIAAGDQFGALMLASDDDFPLSVIADESSVLFRLQKDVAHALVEQFPKFRSNLLKKIGLGVKDSMLGIRRERSKSKIIAFLHVNDRTHKLIRGLASRLADLGEEVGLLIDATDAPIADDRLQFKLLRNVSGDFVDEQELLSTLQGWSGLKRILICTTRTIPKKQLDRIQVAADKLFYTASPSDFEATLKSLEQSLELEPARRKKTHLLWVLDDHNQVAPHVPKLSRLVRRDFKIRMPGEEAAQRDYDADVERVIHYLRDVSIGLALSGGAAHGMAHLGVLKALEEAGIAVDRIAGTSAGVLTGVIYAAGYSPDWGIQQFPHELEPSSLYKWLPKGDGFYLLGKYRSGGWAPLLRKHLSNWRLEQLPIPISTVTTDLISAESVVRSSGNAADAIMESINLPVLSPPIPRDGKLLVDGGILNNLPADVLVEEGCNFVIGVDVAAHIEKRVGDNTSSTPTDEMKTPGAVSALLRCLRVQAHNMSAFGGQAADLIIAPDVSSFESTDFGHTAAMADIGQRATVEAVPRMREFLHRLDAELFDAH